MKVLLTSIAPNRPPIAWGTRALAVSLLIGILAILAVLIAYQAPYRYALDLYRQSDAIFATGFDKMDDDPTNEFRWTAGNSSLVFPAVAQNQSYRLSLRLAAGPRPASLPPPVVALFANGVLVRSIQARAALRTYTLDIPPQTISKSPDLVIQISAPTFVPSDVIPDSSDSRHLGVVVDHFELMPLTAPNGGLALPPANQWLGWAVATWLWLGLILIAGWGKKWQVSLGLVLLAIALEAIGLVLARPWVAAGVYYICIALAAACVVVRPFSGWLEKLVSNRRIPFEFLQTLGIENLRLRALVEGAVVLALGAIYLVRIVLPLGNETLGDFSVYYAGANVWLQGGNLYDQTQLQQFNLTHHLLDGPIGPFTSPPSALVLFAPFAVLPFAQAKTAWLVFGFVLLVASGLFLWLAVRASVNRPPSSVWLALMFYTSGSLQHTFEFGQVNTLYSFLFALGLWAWTVRRSVVTGVAMVFGAAIKVFSGIFLVYFLFKRAWRALAATITGGAFLILVTSLFAGMQTWLNYALEILPDASAHRVSSFDQSLLIFLRRTNYLMGLVHDNPQLDKTPSAEMSIIAFVFTLFILVLTAAWLGRFAHRDALHEQLEFAAVIVVMMLVLPRMWEHYLMWVILPLYLIMAFLANRTLQLAEQIAVVIVLCMSWVMSQDSPELFTRSDWPTALISVGLYGVFLIYLCLLYMATRSPLRAAVALDGAKVQSPSNTQPLKAKV